jgi:hypothetical protein
MYHVASFAQFEQLLKNTYDRLSHEAPCFILPVYTFEIWKHYSHLHITVLMYRSRYILYQKYNNFKVIRAYA